MKRTNKEIISEIKTLLAELEGADPRSLAVEEKTNTAVKKNLSGCIGAIQSLIDEGFLDTLKTVPQVVEKLREEGQPYSKELVSMNLLNLLKPPRKILRRIKQNKQWNYIVRK
ncbi:MAG: hypothetical protein AAB536_02055 [Patescibacteria group bacterium]